MAVAKQVLRSDKTRRKSGKTTKTKRGERASGEETAPLDGAECLRQAVDRRLARNSEKLADLLEAMALEGDLATTKAMVVLADGKKPEPVKKRRGPSQAELLEMEPPWPGEREEGYAETGTGGVEAEG
jgi:hypothetical protein